MGLRALSRCTVSGNEWINEELGSGKAGVGGIQGRPEIQLQSASVCALGQEAAYPSGVYQHNIQRAAEDVHLLNCTCCAFGPMGVDDMSEVTGL